MNAVILTVWLCMGAQPTCLPADDPTGPPSAVEGPASIEGCEAFFKRHVEANPAPKGMVARHTCEWKGTEL